MFFFVADIEDEDDGKSTGKKNEELIEDLGDVNAVAIAVPLRPITGLVFVDPIIRNLPISIGDTDPAGLVSEYKSFQHRSHLHKKSPSRWGSDLHGLKGVINQAGRAWDD